MKTGLRPTAISAAAAAPSSAAYQTAAYSVAGAAATCAAAAAADCGPDTDPQKTLRLAVLMLHHARLLHQQPASPTSDPTPILLCGMLLQHPLRLLGLRHARLQQQQPVTPTRPAAYSATAATSSASAAPAFGLLEPAARWLHARSKLRALSQ